jgi:hypothetical protein
VDENATSLTGYSIGAQVARQSGTHWLGNLAVAATSPAFEVNDLGFQTRTDRRDVAGTLPYQENRPGSFLRNYSVSTNVRFEYNFDWQRIQGLWSNSFTFRTLGFWGGVVRLTRSLRALDDRNTRGGPLLERPAYWNGMIHVGSDSRKAVSVFTTVNGSRDAYDGWSAGGNVTTIIRMSERWSLQIGPSYNRTVSQAQYVGTVPDAAATEAYGAYYLFAPLRQTTGSMETRLARPCSAGSTTRARRCTSPPGSGTSTSDGTAGPCSERCPTTSS